MGRIWQRRQQPFRIGMSRMIENIVAIGLLRRGYELYAGVLYKKEIEYLLETLDVEEEPPF